MVAGRLCRGGDRSGQGGGGGAHMRVCVCVMERWKKHTHRQSKCVYVRVCVRIGKEQAKEEEESSVLFKKSGREEQQDTEEGRYRSFRIPDREET